MKFNKFLNLYTFLILGTLTLIWGCGSGGGSTPNVAVGNGASVTIISSGGSEYIVQGDNMDSVGGIDLTINYDGSTMFSPTVTQGAFVSGALMNVNTGVPGKIRIALISTNGFSGSGQIATISFAANSGTGNVSIASVTMIDTVGRPIPLT